MGTRVAIAAFDSEHQNISNYIMDELAGALTGSSLEVTDRRNLAVVYKGLGFQMTGDVSDETAASIGKFLGAQYVITGQLLKTGNHYRYRVSGINVETAVQESSTRLDVQNSRDLQSLIADLRSAKVTTPVAYSRPATPPGTAGAFLDRGILFAVRGDWELAIADFTEAIKLDGTLAAAWVFRGRAFAASVSFMLEIEEDFSDFIAIAEDAKNITTEQKAGYNKAIADYTQAIKLDPNFAPAYRNRGVAYSYSGDYDKALMDFNQCLRLNPNDPATYRERGNVYGFKGDDTRCLADYNRAINVNPNYAGLYVNRGVVYSR
jgi:tetratricopeptide (TPR) repeat protein